MFTNSRDQSSGLRRGLYPGDRLRPGVAPSRGPGCCGQCLHPVGLRARRGIPVRLERGRPGRRRHLLPGTGLADEAVRVAGALAGSLPQLCADIDGFSLHAAVRCGADDRQALEQLSRYITRPALANERVQTNAAGQVVLNLKTPWRDGATAPWIWSCRRWSSCSGALSGSFAEARSVSARSAEGRNLHSHLPPASRHPKAPISKSRDAHPSQPGSVSASGIT